MGFDPRSIAMNWVRCEVDRKREEEKRQAEYWAKRPMAHPWRVAIKHPPPGVVPFGDLYLILSKT